MGIEDYDTLDALQKLAEGLTAEVKRLSARVKELEEEKERRQKDESH